MFVARTTSFLRAVFKCAKKEFQAEQFFQIDQITQLMLEKTPVLLNYNSRARPVSLNYY